MVALVALKSRTFGTKKVKAGEPFTCTRQYARIWVGLKLARYEDGQAPVGPEVVTPQQMIAANLITPEQELESLSDKYKDLFGRRPHHTWDADKIRDKIAEAEVASQE